ncbi:unnamed protein product [Pocillopora meandrina]|uniref:SRR1-like domain-containing protein n=1 Tax=Pocillopora meandrina TaxID=46732 RepID=A0AAU9WD65_9CNID|nr:unnamed protein product [Pocillopora meandrina]
MADDDGFRVVKKSKGRKHRNNRDKNGSLVKSRNISTSYDSEKCDVNELKTKIEKCRQAKVYFFTKVFPQFCFCLELLCDGHYKKKSCCPAESAVGPDNKFKVIPEEPVTDIVCYGIGKLSSCPIARYQFAFLLLLRELLKISGLCFIYEPHFSQDDKVVVEELGCSLIDHNEEGKRRVENLTLFFMLHCGKPLYNSVLWANWGLGLSNVIILGNRFTSYQERIPSRKLREEASYIYNILPYTSETPIPNTFHHSDIFNDSGIHWFPREVLATVPETLWKDCAEPVYCEDDPEIVTSDVNISVS